MLTPTSVRIARHGVIKTLSSLAKSGRLNVENWNYPAGGDDARKSIDGLGTQQRRYQKLAFDVEDGLVIAEKLNYPGRSPERD